MSDIRRIESGPRLSEAVIYNGVLRTAGLVAERTEGQSVYEQTREILEYLDTLLAQVGSDKTKLLKANIWLTDITTIGEMNRAWDAWAVNGKTPARATVESKLAGPGWAVEIMVEAAV